MPKLTGDHGWSYLKFRRRAQDWATVGVAAVARRSNGGVTEPAIALVSMGATPLRAAARRRRRGPPAADPGAVAAEGTDPPSDTNGSAEYRRHLVQGARPAGGGGGERAASPPLICALLVVACAGSALAVPARPDLVETAVTVSQHGATVSVTDAVWNRGVGLRFGRPPCTPSTASGSVRVPLRGCGPAPASRATVRLAVPVYVRPGSYRLRACADGFTGSARRTSGTTAVWRRAWSKWRTERLRSSPASRLRSPASPALPAARRG